MRSMTTTWRSCVTASTISWDRSRSTPAAARSTGASIRPVRGDLFDWLGDAVLRFDASGYLTYSNESAHDLLGDVVQIGDHWKKLVTGLAPGAANRIAHAVPGAVAKNGYWRGEVKVLDKAGEGDVFTVLLAADIRAEQKSGNSPERSPGGYLLI